MAAFGISFPKLTLCRTPTSKADTSTISTTPTAITTPTATTTPTTTTTTPTPTTGARTLSLSIKNIPSQSLHYDISTTTIKKKATSFATILAIDGETKQLPKTLSVFNELQLDDDDKKSGNIDENRRREENSSNIIVPSSLSSLDTIDYRSDIRFLANTDSKKFLHDSKNKEKNLIQEQRSNHTFTSPTSSLSNESSSNDLHLTLSTISVDLPQLKYAIEKFLADDDDDPVYQIAEEFSSVYSLYHQDYNGNAHKSNETTLNIQHHQHDKIDSIEFNLMYKTNTNDEILSHPPSISNNMKWYVSELRINRPLIYCTQWTNGQQRGNNRKLSHSAHDLKQFYNTINCSENDKYTTAISNTDDITYSTLSLDYLNNQQQQQRRHQSDDNILLNNRLSYTDDDDDLNNLHSDEDDQHLSPLIIQRTLNRSLGKDDTLIRNESVKKKLFDILNDDELENACLEDMSQEFEKLSLTHHHHRDLSIINSFSSSSDDVVYSSSPNEFHLPYSPPVLLLSSSYNENLSTNINNTTECYFSRSRLTTTSLDKIPINHNAYDHRFSSYHSRPSYEKTVPSWSTSPLPQWRTDDQLSMVSVLKKHSSKNDDYLNGIDTIDPNRLLRTKVTEYGVKKNKYREKYNHHHHHHRKEQKHVSYSLLNTSTPLVDDSTTILPIIQDTSSNILMFI
ncbi:unnamed protein product [Rotaria sordida]|uniref:Uncharacterized protein n=1 Tax=Rotaria sordida TaxID=392033 RepID=A0A814W454_9BILA|nr:unnamed protein product [Rotaria sordida]